MVKTEYSLTDLLMATLGSGRSGKRFRAILRERQFSYYKENSVSVTLARLHKKKYICNSPSGWSLTKVGKHEVRKIHLFSYISSPFKKNSPDAIIISFDVPEVDRVMRNWLRNQIKIFGYKMLQQSLWVGPGPLPSTFLKRLKELDIRKNVKTFRIAKV